MSTFKVTVEQIGKVWKHSNADSLDLASVDGMSFQFVMGKDSCKVGDFVIYFPIDSLLPQKVLDVLPEVIVKKLAGKNHNRIKTVKLRGEISQGLAIKWEEFPLEKFLAGSMTTSGNLKVKGCDITTWVEVEKYEPPVVNMGNCKLHKLPEASPHYDIEGADRNPHIIQHLIDLDVDVVVTEKLEGTNLSNVCELPEAAIRICQRSGEVIPDEGAISIYHEGAKREMLPDKSRQIAVELNKTTTIRGELIGPSIQGNIYQLKHLEVPVFEIWLNGKPIDWLDQKALMDKHLIKGVPVLFIGKLKDFLAGKTVQEASNGKSVLNPNVAREGIVIRPVKELPDMPGYGRVLIKQRSPEYLAKSEY